MMRLYRKEKAEIYGNREECRKDREEHRFRDNVCCLKANLFIQTQWNRMVGLLKGKVG